jgi:hypothetical protein
MKCEICGLRESEKTWYLEPKQEVDPKFIVVCKDCYVDLIMIRRWRRHGR